MSADITPWQCQKITKALRNLCDARQRLPNSSDDEARSYLLDHFNAAALELIEFMTKVEVFLQTEDDFTSYPKRLPFSNSDQCVFCGSEAALIPARSQEEKKPSVNASDDPCRSHNTIERVATLLDAVEDPKRVYEMHLHSVIKELKQWVKREREKREREKSRKNRLPENVVKIK